MRFNMRHVEDRNLNIYRSIDKSRHWMLLITEKPSQTESMNFESNEFSECATIRHDFEQIANMPFVRIFGEAHKFRAETTTAVLKHNSWRKTACYLLKSSYATKICEIFINGSTCFAVVHRMRCLCFRPKAIHAFMLRATCQEAASPVNAVHCFRVKDVSMVLRTQHSDHGSVATAFH